MSTSHADANSDAQEAAGALAGLGNVTTAPTTSRKRRAPAAAAAPRESGPPAQRRRSSRAAVPRLQINTQTRPIEQRQFAADPTPDANGPHATQAQYWSAPQPNDSDAATMMLAGLPHEVQRAIASASEQAKHGGPAAQAALAWLARAAFNMGKDATQASGAAPSRSLQRRGSSLTSENYPRLRTADSGSPLLFSQLTQRGATPEQQQQQQQQQQHGALDGVHMFNALQSPALKSFFANTRGADNTNAEPSLDGARQTGGESVRSLFDNHAPGANNSSSLHASEAGIGGLHRFRPTPFPHEPFGAGVASPQLAAFAAPHAASNALPALGRAGVAMNQSAVLAHAPAPSVSSSPTGKPLSAGDAAVQREARLLRAGTSESRAPAARWNDEEDEQLRRAVAVFHEKNWKSVAERVPGRDSVQCLQRWRKVLKPGLVKGPWAPEEDAQLRSLLKADPSMNWGAVASSIPGRTAKQCRERWCLNLDPSINRGKWTPAEDVLLLQLHEQMGNKWAEIKAQFTGRTENGVKTRHKSLMRAHARRWSPEQDARLLELAAELHKNWGAVAQAFEGRSRNSVRTRARYLEALPSGAVPAQVTPNAPPAAAAV